MTFRVSFNNFCGRCGGIHGGGEPCLSPADSAALQRMGEGQERDRLRERETACYPSSCCGRETAWVKDGGGRSLRACPCGREEWF